MDIKWLDEIWEKTEKKLAASAERAFNKIPYTAVDGVYDDKNDYIQCWTNGFWPGMMWLMYAATKKEIYKKTAENAEKMLDRAFCLIDELNHDVGFMWHISSGANYRITGNYDSYVRNLYAANLLAGRFDIRGNYLRAWNGEWQGVDTKGITIIDCMMNLPLLYWASKVTDDDRYKSMAIKHADKTMENHIREDGSVNHIVKYDVESGNFERVYGGQGFGEGSVWSRGQAWAIYGFVLSYIYTRDKKYLATAIKAADYFISEVSGDWVPKCDFKAPKNPVIYDNSAAMIAASGLIELSKNIDEGKKYFEAALKLLEAAIEHYADFSVERDSVMTGGTEAYHFGRKHIPIIYSDFYFVEALTKLKNIDINLW